MKFQTILADPPWDYEVWAESGAYKSPVNHYDVQGANWILSLPVQAVCEKNAVLLLWTTWPMLELGIRVVQAWGFKYKSGFPWLKVTRDNMPRIGTGYHTRVCSEVVLIGTKGKPRAPKIADRKEGVLFNQQGAHSKKPAAIYERAEAYDGAYLELFARPDGGLFPLRDGWTQLGNEIDGKDIVDALRELAETDAPHD
jgi:N6-adenosine-specific RNA methylase IME4